MSGSRAFGPLPATGGVPRLVVAFIAVLSSGCVVHEARVTVPPSPVAAPGEDAAGPTHMQLGSRPVAPASTIPVVQSGPLPQDLRVSAWRMDPTGRLLCRAEERVTTPLCWWQRFPCDAIVDLVPVDVTARADAVIECQPVPETDAVALAEAARCDGYAHDDAMRTPHVR